MKAIPNGDFSGEQENFQKPLRCTEELCAWCVAVDTGSKLAMIISFLTGILIQNKKVS